MALLNPPKPASSATGHYHQKDGSTRQRRVHPLVWILAAGLIVRAALWFYWADLPIRIVDEQHYSQLAVRLLEQGQYVDEHGERTSLRPPLYPILVAGIYRIFGTENYAAVRAVQGGLSLLTVLIVYRLGCLAWSRRVALWAAATVCFYPSLLGYNQLLLSETLFTLLATMTSWLSVEALQRRSLRCTALVGLTLGVGALVRSILWLFAPVLSVYLLITWKGPWLQRLAAAGVPLAFCVVTIAPWAIRNTQLHKTFVVVDVMGGRNAMMGNYEHTPLEQSWATIELVQGERAWYRVLARETPGYGELTQGQIDKVAMQHGIRFALRNPLLTIRRDLVRFFNFWQLERTLIAGAVRGYFGDLPKALIIAAALAICGSYATGILLGIFGALNVAPADLRIHGLLMLSIIFPCVIHTLIFAHSRYHIPVMPIVLLYAAATVVHWRTLWQGPQQRRIYIAVLACCILVLGWAREIIFVDLVKASQVVSAAPSNSQMLDGDDS